MGHVKTPVKQRRVLPGEMRHVKTPVKRKRVLPGEMGLHGTKSIAMGLFTHPTKALLAMMGLIALLLVAAKFSSYNSQTEAALQDALLEAKASTCSESLQGLFQGKGTLLDNLFVSIHRNGERKSCGSAPFDVQAFHTALATMDNCLDMNKYEVESFLTSFFAMALPEESCSRKHGREGLLQFCDMSQTHTPHLLDYDALVEVPEGSLPCRFHTREGLRIVSVQQLVDLLSHTCKLEEKTCQAHTNLHLYAVPAGRPFMFAPSYVGEIFKLPHVQTASGLPVSLEVLSVSPRVFDLYNLFTKEEAESVVQKILAETKDSHRIKQSTTGVEKTVYKMRTSESGFDSDSKTAIQLKQRCMTALGYDEYWVGHTDGLQVLRYNLTTAYGQHIDYMSDRTGGKIGTFDFDSTRKGGNRFATILLYMTDLEEGAGGETVFSNAWPPEQEEEDHVQIDQALAALRASGDATALEENSWEEKMVAECRTRLAVRPHAGRAILFYSQYPDGGKDPDSLHGGCPVLKGEKWAANLWVWNTPREGYEGAPFKEKDVIMGHYQYTFTRATFKNSGKQFQEAELFYLNANTSWGKIAAGGSPVVARTYKGHEWGIKVNGELVQQWLIDGKEANVKFEF